MFWKFNLLPSQVDSLLEREDLTLDELLEEEDVLQECKAQNSKLLDFLVVPEHLEKLVNLSISLPNSEIEEKRQYKFPYIACELLTSDVPVITDSLMTNTTLLDKIYTFIESDSELNSLLASFFSKIMGLLTSRKSKPLLEYLQNKDDFVGLLLKHINTSAIMDVLLRLITCIESTECRKECIQWLDSQRLVQRLVELIGPAHSEEKHCNAAQSLCDIVRMSREYLSQNDDKSAEDPLLKTVESEETINELLTNILCDDRSESILGNGLSVIQIILEQRKIPSSIHEESCGLEKPSQEPDNVKSQGIINTTSVLAKRLTDIQSLLLQPPRQHYSCMQTTIGALEPPLGNCRLQIARLITTLVITNSKEVNEELATTGCINTLLDLFFKYTWNNFLHTQVEQCVGAILNCVIDIDNKESPLLSQLLGKECKLVERILDAWEDNDQHQSRPGGRRRGYMGHLFRIACHIADGIEQGQNGERLKELIQDLEDETKEKWQTFVTGSLANARKKNAVSFKNCYPLHSGSEDEEPELSNISFPQESAMQEAFSEFQQQHMTSNFIDQFGFSEDTLGEQDDPIDTDRISSIKFENSANARSLFEQACSERAQQFNDINDEEDEKWEEKEITFDPRGRNAQVGIHLPSQAGNSSSDSSDSEEDLDSITKIHQILPTTSTPNTATNQTDSTATSSSPSKTENMDIDSTEWSGNLNDVAMENTPVAMDFGNAWPSNETSSTTNDSGNWAKFDAPKASSSSDQDNWADFTNISATSTTTVTLSSSTEETSPTAMDTEPSSRADAYKSTTPMDSCELDSTRESVGGSISVSSSSDSTSTHVYSSTDASESITTTNINATSPVSTSKTSIIPDGVDSTSDSNGAAGSTPEFRNPPINFCDDDELPGASSSCITSLSPDSLVPKLDLPDLENDDDDLDDNFDFLANTGLLRSRDGGEQNQQEELSSSSTVGPQASPRPDATESGTAAGVSSTSALEAAAPELKSADDDDEKSAAQQREIEEARAKAKAAMDSFTSMSEHNSSSNENGPV